MSRWTHAVCPDCWDTRHPDRSGYRLAVPELESCCYCDTTTLSGLYDREDPADTPCKGENGTVHRPGDSA